MTSEQRAALRWAIETADMKAVIAARAEHRSSSRNSAMLHRQEAEKMRGFKRSLEEILNGAGQ